MLNPEQLALVNAQIEAEIAKLDEELKHAGQLMRRRQLLIRARDNMNRLLEKKEAA